MRDILPTFRRFVEVVDAQQGGPPPARPEAEGHPVPAWLRGRTVDDVDVLWQLYDEFVYQLVSEMSHDPDRPWTPSQLVDLLAEEVILSHLGADWYDKHVTHASSSRQSRGYLAGVDHPLAAVLYKHREYELARRLYQFQSFAWFDDLLSKLSNAPLSGVAFELDVIWALQTVSPHVEGREEHGELGRGNNFDVVALWPGGAIPIEAKAKDDSTPFSAGTVRNTIKQAASQLPRGDRGLIFLRIPFVWVGPGLEERYVDAAVEGMRQTSRVAAIVTAIDKPHLNEDRRSGSVLRVHHLLPHEDCPDTHFNLAKRFVDFWDGDLTMFAPRAPF